MCMAVHKTRLLFPLYASACVLEIHAAECSRAKSASYVPPVLVPPDDPFESRNPRRRQRHANRVSLGAG